MAYCVHCGVKLGEAEKKCPLCGTEAHDPAEPIHEDAPKAFPVRTLEQTLLINRRYAISLLSLLLLVPAGVCILFDLLGGEGISWGVYPAGVLVLIWIAVAVPLLVRRHRLYSTILITGTTLAAYLYMVEAISGRRGWFLPVVLPALGIAIAMICCMVWLTRSKRVRLLRLFSIGLAFIGLLCFAIEMLCVHSGIGPATVSWSPYVIIPCLFLALLLYVISRSGPLSAELKRRFHF